MEVTNAISGLVRNTEEERDHFRDIGAEGRIILKWVKKRNRVLSWEVNKTDSGLNYRDADKSLARPTSGCILFDGKNISFDASLVYIYIYVYIYTYIYINSTNIPPVMIINMIHEHQNLLSLYLASYLVVLRTYQHPCTNIFIID
jgi:hypothetical protein